MLRKKKNQQVMLTHSNRGNFGIFSRLLYFPIFKISQNYREKILVAQEKTSEPTKILSQPKNPLSFSFKFSSNLLFFHLSKITPSPQSGLNFYIISILFEQKISLWSHNYLRWWLAWLFVPKHDVRQNMINVYFIN